MITAKIETSHKTKAQMAVESKLKKSMKLDGFIIVGFSGKNELMLSVDVDSEKIHPESILAAGKAVQEAFGDIFSEAMVKKILGVAKHRCTHKNGAR